MAWSTVETHVANPAGKRTNMTAKQIKYFGTRRQKAALKAKHKKNRHSAKHRHAPAKRNTARKRAVARHTKHNAAPRPKKRAVARHTRAQKRSHRSNPELVSFLVGNPAKRRSKKGMAATKKRKRAVARHNAGPRRKKHSSHHHTRRRGNPAGIPLKDWIWGGGGVLVGFFGSAALPQFLAPSYNTGGTGYAITAAAAIGLAFLSNMVFPRERALTFGVAAGGAANLLRRVIQDQTPFGPYLSNPGMGDYMVANWGPPRMSNGLYSAMAEAPGTPWSGPSTMTASSGISGQDMMDIRASRPC